MLFTGIFPLSGCTSTNSKSMQIPSSALESITPYSIKSYTDTQPYIYRFISPEGLPLPIYFLNLSDCNNDIKVPTLALTRQLFIGIDKLKVKEQSIITKDSNSALLSDIEGNVDGSNIYIRSLSYRNRNCIQDVIVWSLNLEELNKIPQDILINLSNTIVR